jgi:hypothetical protein
MAINVSAPLTLRTLEDHLWASADLFRGLTDVEVQRDYVLALLFFKRACDLYSEETAAAVEELGAVEGAEAIIAANLDAYHSLRIPEGALWDEVRETDRDGLGTALNDALRDIAAANPRQLFSVFDYTDFNNRKALPPENLAGVVAHFNELGPLTKERVPPDMLGAAYEWLIAKFASEAGKAGGEFYTPAAGSCCGQPSPETVSPLSAATAGDERARKQCNVDWLAKRLRDAVDDGRVGLHLELRSCQGPPPCVAGLGFHVCVQRTAQVLGRRRCREVDDAVHHIGIGDSGRTHPQRQRALQPLFGLGCCRHANGLGDHPVEQWVDHVRVWFLGLIEERREVALHGIGEKVLVRGDLPEHVGLAANTSRLKIALSSPHGSNVVSVVDAHRLLH